ncbi:hypothetical protein CPB86DRAFT_873653 [Serendipita vermifera]|nr:hypothetical protein CPB86DRAFT_873653 [Serendipita vermifera]
MSTTNDNTTESRKNDINPSERSQNEPVQQGLVTGQAIDQIAEHYPSRVVPELSPEQFLKILGIGRKRLKSIKSYPKHVRKEGECYINYLNRLSIVVHKRRYQKQQPILFVKSEYTFFHHATRIECRPDFVGLRLPKGRTMRPQRIRDLYDHRPQWSLLETIGEARFTGETQTSHEISHTGFLLQARPDLTQVLGLYVKEEKFRLCVSNACGVANLEELTWNNPHAVSLLYAWMSRLYSPFRDPDTIRNVTSESKITFQIRVNGKTYRGCKLIKTGTAFGRRTTIFNVPSVKPFVIKYQYIEKDQQFLERKIISNIHAKGPFPGVVRIHATASSQLEAQVAITNHSRERVLASSKPKRVHCVPREPRSKPIIVKLEILRKGRPVSLERQRIRLVMEDKGIPIMNVTTPRDALIALYDVLEVTRFLWRTRRTLHRDISEGNIMVREDGLSTIPKELQAELEDMCFATALLGADGPNPETNRLQTTLLLIDFDVAHNDHPGHQKSSSERAGTPYFMARAVRSPEIRDGPHCFFPMPQLSAGATHYEQHLPGRLQMFKPNDLKFEIQQGSKPLETFQHKLRYDAESVFWLLLWWSMHARPADDKLESDCIRRTDWVDFTAGIGSDDRRRIFIDGKGINREMFHPEYQPLEALLSSMANQLKGDHEMLGDSDVRKHDEYLHEAFQRLIFEFLSEHLKTGSRFLTLEKSLSRRRLQQEEAMKQPLPSTDYIRSHVMSGGRTSSLKRSRDEREDDDYQQESRPSKKLKV